MITILSCFVALDITEYNEFNSVYRSEISITKKWHLSNAFYVYGSLLNVKFVFAVCVSTKNEGNVKTNGQIVAK